MRYTCSCRAQFCGRLTAEQTDRKSKSSLLQVSRTCGYGGVFQVEQRAVAAAVHHIVRVTPLAADAIVSWHYTKSKGILLLPEPGRPVEGALPSSVLASARGPGAAAYNARFHSQPVLARACTVHKQFFLTTAPFRCLSMARCDSDTCTVCTMHARCAHRTTSLVCSFRRLWRQRCHFWHWAW